MVADRMLFITEGGEGATEAAGLGDGSLMLFLQTFIDICKKLPDTNIASLVFALVSGVVLVVVKELNARYMHKIHFPIPTEMIVVSSASGGPRLSPPRPLP